MKIKLTSGNFALISDADAPLVAGCRWSEHQSNCTSYAFTQRGNEKVYLHRLVLGLAHGDPREAHHRNYNGLDCQRENLEVTDRHGNALRVRKTRGVSALKGVAYENSKFRNKPWRAQVWVEGKNLPLGYFRTQEEAHEVWREASLRLRGVA